MFISMMTGSSVIAPPFREPELLGWFTTASVAADRAGAAASETAQSATRPAVAPHRAPPSMTSQPRAASPVAGVLPAETGRGRLLWRLDLLRCLNAATVAHF